ncbi:LacI family DNA-binding transcriptional regulator [Robbsia andropogonis]|uniref:LacI family DNA-binding transcriptional regulator n=1 Tax=Robbsia andropogonis TaxID=28092 RepID=UPI0004ACFF25|nr:LacI family DNA-binding transcriptional regulator [Robbsia andropogonis]MCP1116906.1 LacI family transcriptional regulator [Robbsia andropogonis]MCP1126415.1 LacI family transcriptional regulator [Robbsia andropogonis]
MKAVTLRDVAEVAHVSVATASRVLAGKGLAGPATQARIREAASRLGYRPNKFAQGLKTRHAQLIGVVIHNLENASFRRIAAVVQGRMREKGYQVMLCITGDDAQQERDAISALTDYNVSGVVVVPTGQNSEVFVQLERSGVPVLCVVRRDPSALLESVLSADVDGAYDATRYLLQMGHRRIGLVVGRRGTTSGDERRAGYLRALDEAFVPFDPALIIDGPYLPQTGTNAAMALLDRPDPPTAIFVANHESALGVMRVVSERGLRVPEDISLLCAEDSPWFEWGRPTLSVVDSGPEALANLAADRILQRIDGAANGAREYRVGQRLMLRGSCRAPAEPLCATDDTVDPLVFQGNLSVESK